MTDSAGKDLTAGKPLKLILGFAVPMLLGYLFQQFYNMVDTIVVGKCLGVSALASVGSTSSINFMINGFCIGVCSGFSIPVAQRFGAGDGRGLRRFAANAAWLADAVCALDAALPAPAVLAVSAHPLDVEHLEGRALTDRVLVVHDTATIDALAVADYVVTDYSAVAFEALLASKKTYFYVPDIEEYRISPGLNVDPLTDAPTISTADAADLAARIADDIRTGSYDAAGATAFARSYGIEPDPTYCAVDAIVAVIRTYIEK